ncbi:MAG TPA: PPC domain-containing DNA-binding protein, partial [Opitutaceae bacterium]|nr:PPC domain-containing DNA-binding protein [Opitutaceae bacterium]
MKPHLCALALLLAASTAWAQETRVEKTNSAPTPQQDARENSPDVPDVYAITGKFERVVVLRFKYQADLLAGLERMVKEQHIKNGVILSAVGSVRSYHLHSVSNRTFPSKDMFVENPTGSADIVSMNGYVMNGRLHPHITLADSQHAFGG